MDKCSYKFSGFFRDLSESHKCKEEALPNNDFCILHADFPKNEEELEKKIKEKIDNDDFDFEGAKLGNIVLGVIKTEKNINFRNAIVEENVKFNIIDGVPSLPSQDQVEFGEIDFRGAVIGGNIVFYKAEVKGNVRFGDPSFDGTEVRVKVGAGIDFRYSKIKGYVCFKDIYAGSGINFQRATIEKKANFQGAKIEGDLNFINAKIFGCGNFIGAEINGNARFNDDYWEKFEIKGEANFGSIRVKEDAFFGSALFEENVDFSSAIFNRNVDFSKTRFNKPVNFKDSSFSGKGVFDNIKEFNASFEGASLKNIAFRDCDLTDARFKQVNFENCELSTSEWKDKIPEHKDYEKGKIDAKDVADTYRRIRQSLQHQGAYDKAGEFYVKEMDMKREVYKKENKELWLLYTALSFLTQYGENSKRIGLILVGYLIIYSVFIYYLPDNKLVIPLSSGFLSVLTALFVYTFARKMAR